ncbi:MAG: helix-turn-helix transcriptional regulator [Sphingomonas sp.]
MENFGWPIGVIPRIAVAGRFRLGDRGHETRYRGAMHALHLHDYAGRMRLADAERAIAAGDVTISPAGRTSSYDLDAAGQHWCIHFTADDADARVMLPLHVGGQASVRERMAHIAALHRRAGDDPVAAVQAGLALQTLLLDLVAPAAAAPNAAERAAAVIDARFAEPLDVAAIAAAIDRSPAHLARAFRTRYATTIPHRLIARRVEHARYLLESTDLPIWRIAERVGIPDPQHFNKTVRRLTGASPSAIRATSAAKIVDPDR